MSDSSEILQIAEKLLHKSKEIEKEELENLLNAAVSVGKSWCGSWLGYQARVYYRDFQTIPPGAHFSIEWGSKDRFGIEGTVGDWIEYDFDYVVEFIHHKAENPDLERFNPLVESAIECFEESQSQLLSILSNILKDQENDKFLNDIEEKIEKKKIISTSKFIEYIRPSGQQMSRDLIAIQSGIHAPPHIFEHAHVSSILHPFDACEELSKLARRAATHIQNIGKNVKREESVGTKVFIGHGNSNIWKDLKDFIQDRLHLSWDEFNRVPAAGITNQARLLQMMDEAAFAFIIMTAEDEQPDGILRARENVVHEAGLFQGRLGFEQSIILLEEGCEEFSNIHGLGQIRFPKGNISAKFEEIREVLERENLIEKK